METDIIQGKWLQIKGKIKQQWGKLTDDDLMKMKGNYEELCGKLCERYGYQKEQAKKEVATFIETNKLKEDEKSKV